MYYVLVIDYGSKFSFGTDKAYCYRYYARSNERAENKDKPIEWTRDISEALVYDSYRPMHDLYLKVREETGDKRLDIVGLHC